MKKKMVFLAISLLISTPVFSMKYFITAAFYSHCPITVYVNGEQYILTEAMQYGTKPPEAIVVDVDDNFSWSAYDKDGNSIKDYTPGGKTDDNGNYEFKRIILGRAEHSNNDQDFPSTSESPTSDYAPVESPSGGYTPYNSYESNRSTSNNGLANTLGDSAADLVNVYGNAVMSSMSISEYGVPYFSAEAGYSMAWGVNTRLRYRFGGFGGFSVFGGIGKELIFDPKNKDCLTWNVGLSLCLQNVSLNMSVGETPLCYNKGIFFGLSYEYFFNRWGLIGSVDCGLGDFEKSDPDFIWSLGIGVAFKIWANQE